MSEVDNADLLERIIHQVFHDIADKYDIDVDTIAEIISDYGEMVGRRLEPEAGGILFKSLN